jgi:ribonuclease P protein component
MFAREQRLTEKKLFDLIFRRGTWVRGQTFSLVFHSTPQPGKIGFIITKKIAKSSVVRNQIKRRIRAAFEQVIQQSEFAPLLKKYSLVVLINRSSENQPFDKLTSDVTHQLQKIELTTAAQRPSQK